MAVVWRDIYIWVRGHRRMNELFFFFWVIDSTVELLNLPNITFRFYYTRGFFHSERVL